MVFEPCFLSPRDRLGGIRNLVPSKFESFDFICTFCRLFRRKSTNLVVASFFRQFNAIGPLFVHYALLPKYLVLHLNAFKDSNMKYKTIPKQNCHPFPLFFGTMTLSPIFSFVKSPPSIFHDLLQQIGFLHIKKNNSFEPQRAPTWAVPGFFLFSLWRALLWTHSSFHETEKILFCELWEDMNYRMKSKNRFYTGFPFHLNDSFLFNHAFR